MTVTILLIEDDPGVIHLLARSLGGVLLPEFEEVVLRRAVNRKETEHELARLDCVDLIIWDGKLEDCATLGFISDTRKRYPELPMIAESGDREVVGDQVKAGCDYACCKSDIAKKFSDIVLGILRKLK